MINSAIVNTVVAALNNKITKIMSFFTLIRYLKNLNYYPMTLDQACLLYLNKIQPKTIALKERMVHISEV